MSDYIVGDIQGCLTELKKLLKKVNFDAEKDTLWLTGDLVARGPDSLKTLRFIRSLGSSAKTVLGNHDLHLLAVYHGIKKPKASDKIDAILKADDAPILMEWLAQQPLLIKIPKTKAYMSHAGLSPEWSVDKAIKRAQKAEKKLQSKERVYWLSQMYGNLPLRWQDAQTREEKFRYTINSFTRMRYCLPTMGLDFDQKTIITSNNPQGLVPWFELATIPKDHQWFFGHWAALMGHSTKKNVFALDTGCVWGNYMTMYCIQDKTHYQVKSCR